MLTGATTVLDYPRQIPRQQRQHFPCHLDRCCFDHRQLGHCMYSRPNYIREAIASSPYILCISSSFADCFMLSGVASLLAAYPQISNHRAYDLLAKQPNLLNATHRTVSSKINNNRCIGVVDPYLLEEVVGLTKGQQGRLPYRRKPRSLLSWGISLDIKNRRKLDLNEATPRELLDVLDPRIDFPPLKRRSSPRPQLAH